jgi:hypothetical protein
MVFFACREHVRPPAIRRHIVLEMQVLQAMIGSLEQRTAFRRSRRHQDATASTFVSTTGLGQVS